MGGASRGEKVTGGVQERRLSAIGNGPHANACRTMRDGSKAGKLPSGVQSVLFDSNKSQAMDSELISRLATARCVVSTVPPGDGDASQEGSVWRDPVVQSIDAAARSESRVLQGAFLIIWSPVHHPRRPFPK